MYPSYHLVSLLPCRVYVLSNSISGITGRYDTDDERLFATESPLYNLVLFIQAVVDYLDRQHAIYLSENL